MGQEQVANLKRAFADYDIPWPKDATIFWHPTGLKVSYGNGMLKVSDLNPESHIQFRMSAAEMLKLGWRCIILAWRIRYPRAEYEPPDGS